MLWSSGRVEETPSPRCGQRLRDSVTFLLVHPLFLRGKTCFFRKCNISIAFLSSDITCSCSGAEMPVFTYLSLSSPQVSDKQIILSGSELFISLLNYHFPSCATLNCALKFISPFSSSQFVLDHYDSSHPRLACLHLVQFSHQQLLQSMLVDRSHPYVFNHPWEATPCIK